MKVFQDRVLSSLIFTGLLFGVFAFGSNSIGQGHARLTKQSIRAVLPESKKGILVQEYLDNAWALQEYRDPKNPIRYRSDLEKSIEYCNEAIKLMPSYPDTYVIRGYSHIFLNNRVESRLDFDKAIKLNNLDARIYSSRGTCCGIVSDFDSAISLNSEEPHYYEMRGSLRCKARDFLGGFFDYAKCVELNAANFRDCFDTFVHYFWNDERERKPHFQLIEG